MPSSNLAKIVLLTLLSVSTTFADMAGGEVSVGAYSHSPSGAASYSIPFVNIGSSADLEDTFGWSTNSDFMFKAYIEHPLPLIPNLKLGYTNLTHTGTGSSTQFNWGNLVDFSGELDTSLDMGITDVTAYYEVLDNYVELDLGLTLRYLFGEIAVNPRVLGSTVTGSTSASIGAETVSFSTLTPMLYSKIRFTIPSTDISFQLESNIMNYGETVFYDYELGIRYTFSFGLGIEGGFKALHLDSATLEDGLNMNIDENGFYTTVVWDF